LVLKEVEDETSIDRNLLTKIPFWVQVYGIPVTRMNDRVAHSIGNLFGDVLEFDTEVNNRSNGCLRIRVAINAYEPIPRGTKLTMGGKTIDIKFKYERLPNFCYWCGKLDHIDTDCEIAFRAG